AQQVEGARSNGGDERAVMVFTCPEHRGCRSIGIDARARTAVPLWSPPSPRGRGTGGGGLARTHCCRRGEAVARERGGRRESLARAARDPSPCPPPARGGRTLQERHAIAATPRPGPSR